MNKIHTVFMILSPYFSSCSSADLDNTRFPLFCQLQLTYTQFLPRPVFMLEILTPISVIAWPTKASQKTRGK